MHGPRVAHEVHARPRAACEELVWQHVSLESIAAPARRDDVAGRVRAATCKGIDVIEGGVLQDQRDGAVDAAPSAVTQGGVLQRPLGVATVLRLSAAVRGTASAWRA